MKNISKMVEDAVMDCITDSDIEQAVSNIVENMDIVELLSDNETLKDFVYSSVSVKLDSIIECLF